MASENFLCNDKTCEMGKHSEDMPRSLNFHNTINITELNYVITIWECLKFFDRLLFFLPHENTQISPEWMLHNLNFSDFEVLFTDKPLMEGERPKTYRFKQPCFGFNETWNGEIDRAQSPLNETHCHY